MDAFAERWIYGRGCPRITAAFSYNRKRNAMEFALEQAGNSSAWQSAKSATGIGTREGAGVGVIKVCNGEGEGGLRGATGSVVTEDRERGRGEACGKESNRGRGWKGGVATAGEGEGEREGDGIALPV